MIGTPLPRSSPHLEVHLCTYSTPEVASSVFGTETVSSYVSGPTRLRSSSGHGVDWRTGFQDTVSFTHIVNLLSCPWGRDPWFTRNISFVSRPYFFPHHCIPDRLSIGTGFPSGFFFDSLVVYYKGESEVQREVMRWCRCCEGLKPEP